MCAETSHSQRDVTADQHAIKGDPKVFDFEGNATS